MAGSRCQATTLPQGYSCCGRLLQTSSPGPGSVGGGPEPPSLMPTVARPPDLPRTGRFQRKTRPPSHRSCGLGGETGCQQARLAQGPGGRGQEGTLAVSTGPGLRLCPLTPPTLPGLRKPLGDENESPGQGLTTDQL